MVHLDLDSRQAESLMSVLDAALSDLSYEISNTDRQDYRDKLKEHRGMLQSVARALTDEKSGESDKD